MQVNFISDVTSFYRLIKRQHLGINARMLWFHLFCLWNEAGFPEWLQVGMFRMMSMIQVNNKNALIRARCELIEAGLLVSQRVVNRQPNRYQLLSVPRETSNGMGKKPKIESRCEIEKHRTLIALMSVFTNNQKKSLCEFF